jgi:DNA-binding response OmpR family regulator
VARILIVDDDELVRDVVVHRLRKAGHQVEVAVDGEAGLAAAMATPFDLVLLDSMMPRLSGVEVCRRLRDHDVTSSVAIVMLTARNQDADVERGFAAGADDYIVKPFSPKELVGRVEAILAGERHRREAPIALTSATLDAVRDRARQLGAPPDALASFLRTVMQVEVAMNDVLARHGAELAALETRLDGAFSALAEEARPAS